jgi:hypothetical protein
MGNFLAALWWEGIGRAMLVTSQKTFSMGLHVETNTNVILSYALERPKPKQTQTKYHARVNFVIMRSMLPNFVAHHPSNPLSKEIKALSK